MRREKLREREEIALLEKHRPPTTPHHTILILSFLSPLLNG